MRVAEKVMQVTIKETRFMVILLAVKPLEVFGISDKLD